MYHEHFYLNVISLDNTLFEKKLKINASLRFDWIDDVLHYFFSPPR